MKMKSNIINVACALVAGLAMPSLAAQGQKSDPVEIVFRAEGQEITVRIDGDDTTVKVNGKDVTAERAKSSGNLTTIKDSAGEPLAQVSRLGHALSFARQRGSDRAAIGVEIGDLPPALAEHLELSAGDVIYVTGAVAGRAAAKAGVRAHDVILEIDGEAPVSEAKLREILKKKKPGAKLELTVLRRGVEENVVVECERAKSAGQLFPGFLNQRWNAAAENPFQSNFVFPGQVDAAKGAYKEAIKALKDAEKKSSKNTAAGYRKAFEFLDKLQTDALKKAAANYSLSKPLRLSFDPQSTTSAGASARDYRNLLYGYHGFPQWSGAQKKGGKKGKDGKANTKGTNRASLTPLWPSVSGFNSASGSGNNKLTKQLAALEKRFDRLEQMLEKLAERKKLR